MVLAKKMEDPLWFEHNCVMVLVAPWCKFWCFRPSLIPGSSQICHHLGTFVIVRSAAALYRSPGASPTVFYTLLLHPSEYKILASDSRCCCPFHKLPLTSHLSFPTGGLWNETVFRLQDHSLPLDFEHFLLVHAFLILFLSA